MNKTHAVPRTIGVFTAELDDAYQAGIWQGIEARARERDIGVVTFLGSRIDSPIRSEATANIAYRIIDPRNVDGLIVVSSAVATFLDSQKVANLFSSKPGLPKVSVGLRVKGTTSVVTDGSAAITRIVRHLIDDHGREHFALVGGPENHAEAEDRRRAVVAALGAARIPIDYRLFVPGTFVQESGSDAVRYLLAQNIHFDALICTNDRMAIGAMEALKSAGYRVPEDISVVGFDGIEEGGSTTPPLTTVFQPLRELGSEAVDAICSLLDGDAGSERVLPCRAVILESCGCAPVHKFMFDAKEMPAHSLPREQDFVAELAALANSGNSTAFLKTLNRALTWSIGQGRGLEVWNDYVSVARHRAAGNHPSLLFESARVLIGDAISRDRIAQRIASEKRFATLRSIGAELIGAFELSTMISSLERGLSRLGISGGYLAIFENKDPAQGWSALLMASGTNGGSGSGPDSVAGAGEVQGDDVRENQDAPTSNTPQKTARFKTLELLPGTVDPDWRTRHWVFEPLVFQDEPLGYLLLPGGVSDPSVYDALREQVASALKGNLLVEQIRYHEKILEAEVARRTAELTSTNRELTFEIDRRTKLEEEVVSISNRVMEQIGQDLHDDLCQYLAGISMLASVARNGIPQNQPKSIESLDHVINLLKESIVRVRHIARGLMPGGLEAQGLAVAIEGLVIAARRTYAIDIGFEASEDFQIADSDRALQIYRIVQEALSNAIKHSGTSAIEVRLYREGTEPETTGKRSPRNKQATGARLVAEVRDGGKGMKDRRSGDGMGLRIMRYRAEKANAELVVESRKPGTRVACIVPLEPEENPA